MTGCVPTYAGPAISRASTRYHVLALTFQTTAFINDGCEWLATERLVPTGSDRYAYSYDEEILSCQPDATPARKTPRTGYVLVVGTK